MKRILRSRIFLVLICGLLFTNFGVYAGTTYSSNMIMYKTNDGEKTVESALNELYPIKTMGDATENDILSGKTAIVQGKLITGTLENTEKTYKIISTVGRNSVNAYGKIYIYDSTDKLVFSTTHNIASGTMNQEFSNTYNANF